MSFFNLLNRSQVLEPIERRRTVTTAAAAKPVRMATRSVKPTGTSAGFTLLEVIIAMTLVSTLMLVLWSLFSTFTRLEERSSKAAVELQLVRSLSRQLRTDLQHFAMTPVPADIFVDKQSGDGDGEGGDESNDDESDSDSDSDTEADAESDASDNDESESSNEDASQSSSRGARELTPLDSSSSAGRSLSTFGQSASGSTQGGANSLSAASGQRLTRSDLQNLPQAFQATLPDQTYLRGTASRLEIISRMPYTVDVPLAGQKLGAESRYGTYLLIVYEYRDPRNLKSLLESDPILNPQLFKPDPNKIRNPNDPPEVAKALNPNDNVGFSREAKSWLQVTRDQRRDEIRLQAEAAGLLVNGQLPPAPAQRSALEPLQSTARSNDRASMDSFDAMQQPPWHPPPEIRGRKEQLPEVSKLQFRYFDGETWQLDWPGDDGRLPLAVEVAFDLDPNSPAIRAKEFEEAHAMVLGGMSVTEVAPEEETLDDDLLGLDDPMLSNLVDPTAIVTEYRFIIALPPQTKPKEDRVNSRGQSDDPDADEDFDAASEDLGEFEVDSEGRG